MPDDIYDTPSTTPNFQTELATQLAELVPEAIADGKVDVEKLKELLNGDAADENERFGLLWPGKKRALRAAQEPTTATLRPDFENSKDWDTTKNVFIEGDNLEVLKILQKHYHAKIKMIYIDPPYNTGKDFVYPDNYKEGLDTYLQWTRQVNDEGKKVSTNAETEGRYHSNWLNMMYPRLKLARNLLMDDGVIFISIDDNEIDNLKKLCNEVFGENNFVGILTVENNPKGRKNSAFISVSSEYCVIYAKNKDCAHFIENVPKKASDMAEDEDGIFVHNSGKRVLVGENSFNKYVTNVNSDKNYSVYYRGVDRQLVIESEEFNVVDHQLLSQGYVKYHSYHNDRLVENTYTKKKFHELFSSNSLNFSSDKIYEKNFNDTIRIKSLLVNREYEAIVNGKKQKYSMELTTTGAGTYLKNLFGVSESPFSAPKNIGYIKLLISLFEIEPFIVLDCFSGSATTADAVMQLNADDGGNRRFIMVQLPEPTPEDSEARRAGFSTIPDISRKRIDLAAAKIKAENSLVTENLDTGFRAYKLVDTNFSKWRVSSDIEMDALQQHLFDLRSSSSADDATFDSLLTEILLKQGYSLTEEITSVEIAGLELRTVGRGTVLAYLNEHTKPTLEQLRAVVDADPQRIIVLEDAFQGDDELKTNLAQLTKSKGIELWTA